MRAGRVQCQVRSRASPTFCPSLSLSLAKRKKHLVFSFGSAWFYLVLHSQAGIYYYISRDLLDWHLESPLPESTHYKAQATAWLGAGVLVQGGAPAPGCRPPASLSCLHWGLPFLEVSSAGEIPPSRLHHRQEPRLVCPELTSQGALEAAAPCTWKRPEFSGAAGLHQGAQSLFLQAQAETQTLRDLIKEPILELGQTNWLGP